MESAPHFEAVLKRLRLETQAEDIQECLELATAQVSRLSSCTAHQETAWASSVGQFGPTPGQRRWTVSCLLSLPYSPPVACAGSGDAPDSAMKGFLGQRAFIKTVRFTGSQPEVIDRNTNVMQLDDISTAIIVHELYGHGMEDDTAVSFVPECNARIRDEPNVEHGVPYPIDDFGTAGRTVILDSGARIGMETGGLFWGENGSRAELMSRQRNIVVEGEAARGSTESPNLILTGGARFGKSVGLRAVLRMDGDEEPKLKTLVVPVRDIRLVQFDGAQGTHTLVSICQKRGCTHPYSVRTPPATVYLRDQVRRYVQE